MKDAKRARWSALAALGVAGIGLVVAGALVVGDAPAPDAEAVGSGPVGIRAERRRPPTLRLVDRDDVDGDGLDDAIDPDVDRAGARAGGAGAVGDDGEVRGDAIDPRRAAARAPETSRPYDLQLEAIELPGANPALAGDGSGAPRQAIAAADLPADVLAAAGRAGAGSGGPAFVLGTPSANRSAKPKPAPDGAVAMGAGLPKDVIRRVIRRAMPAIRACYERALAAQPRLEGTVVVVFEIGLDGAVRSAAGTGMDPTVATCVADVIAGLGFPRPDGGDPVRVRYPFVFRAPP